MLRTAWLFFVLCAFPAAASVQPISIKPSPIVLVGRERQIWPIPIRSSEFADIPHLIAISRCEDTQPPQALTTPDPLIAPAIVGSKVKVSFIIGTDGRVHSPLILKSAGPVGDRNVLQAVRSWRYRPATCNGVPTEIEGRIEFSRR
jgi:TonB family protein